MNDPELTHLLNIPSIKKGIPHHVHTQIVLQYTLWFHLEYREQNWTIKRPCRAREFDNYILLLTGPIKVEK